MSDFFDEPPRPSLLGQVFTAEFDGYCTACSWEIEMGDQIRADGKGGWIHADENCEKVANA